ncbi:protein of unknown function [Paenibacillus alvei]|uniref:Uncharacterized protein n=1 Tax=Paenibacillus alvei TaxID=44250 RepID=A0A383RIY3_PAEAL|nr:protein of unknown function [Paenibacillus alvei]
MLTLVLLEYFIEVFTDGQTLGFSSHHIYKKNAYWRWFIKWSG